MSAHLINWFSEVRSFLPWVSFVAGFGGSLHCAGMCGGLVTASCEKSGDVFRYQLGRLVGYLILGLCAGLVGSFLSIKKLSPSLSILPGLLIGGLFVYWGIQNFLGKKAELPAARFLGTFYSKIWPILVQKNSNFTKSFFIGLLSIFLPCGLLYGVALGTVALEHTHEVVFSMFFFWLGTLPSMIVAPKVVQKFIQPLRTKLPKTFAISLITIGILTIGFRVVRLQEVSQKNEGIHSEHKMSCH